MQQFLRKKDSGDIVGNMILMIITVLVSFFILFVGIYFIHYSSVKNDISAMTRNTILQMEQTGYLDDTTKNNFVNQLRGLNFNGADTLQVVGTSMNDVNLPQLKLQVTGQVKLPWASTESSNWLQEISMDVNITQYSVAIGY